MYFDTTARDVNFNKMATLILCGGFQDQSLTL